MRLYVAQRALELCIHVDAQRLKRFITCSVSSQLNQIQTQNRFKIGAGSKGFGILKWTTLSIGSPKTTQHEND